MNRIERAKEILTEAKERGTLNHTSCRKCALGTLLGSGSWSWYWDADKQALIAPDEIYLEECNEGKRLMTENELFTFGELCQIEYVFEQRRLSGKYHISPFGDEKDETADGIDEVFEYLDTLPIEKPS